MVYVVESFDWINMRIVLLFFVCVILIGSVVVGKLCIYICLYLLVLLYGVCFYGDYYVVFFDVLIVLNICMIFFVFYYGLIKIIGYKKI